jgi:hypothetical protein
MSRRLPWAAEITANDWIGYTIRYHEVTDANHWIGLELEWRPFALTRKGAERKARRKIARLNRPPRSTEVHE